MVPVTLTKVERQIAVFMACERVINAERQGLHEAKVGSQSSIESNIEGMAGEIVVAKYLNLYPDMDLQETLPGSVDLISKDGKRIDVKTTKYKNGKLLATLKKGKTPADVYFLVTGQFPSYSIIGWTWSSDLFKDENIVDLGHGDTYALPQERLNLIGKG